MKLSNAFLMVIGLGVSAFGAEHSITVNTTTIVHTLSPNYHGINYTAFWDSKQGSVGSRQALRRAGVQLIRYPGGVPGNYLDWDKIAGSHAGTTTDSLWAYGKAIGAKLLMQTNPYHSKINDAGTLADSTGKHMADWVAYCKSKGFDAPLWEIGNEPEGMPPTNWNYPTQDSILLKPYFNTFNDQSTAMKTANSEITVMGPASANTWYWWAQGELAVFLRYCDKNLNAISLHWYGDGTAYSGIVGLAQTWYANMNFIRTITQKPLYITEWNNHGDKGNINTTIGSAIINADIVGVFTRTGVAGHTWFGCIHGGSNGGYGAWGILYGDGEPKPLDTPTPGYFILPLWTHMGPEVLNVTNTADTINTLTTYAHKKAEGSVQVMLINKSTQRTVEVKFNGFDPTGKKVLIYELKPSNGTNSDQSIMYNGKLNPSPAIEDLPAPNEQACPGTSMTVTLAAYSVTELDFLTVTDPTGLSIINFSATPTEVWNTADQNVTFSVEAKKLNGNITSAILDLSALGGNTNTVMQAEINTGNYTFSYTLPNGAAIGSKSVTLTITDNAGNKKTSIISISVNAPKSPFIIYTDVSSIASFGWNANGTLTEISTGAFEATKAWGFSYTIAGGYSGGGILLYTWGVGLDAAGYKSIRFAYKGPAANMTMQFVGGGNSTSVPISAASAWTILEIPISSFGNMNAINCINFQVTGTNGSTGHMYFDDMRLVPESQTQSIIYPINNAFSKTQIFSISTTMQNGLSISTFGKGSLYICSLQGRPIASKLIAGETNTKLNLMPGIYIVSLKAEGHIYTQKALVW